MPALPLEGIFEQVAFLLLVCALIGAVAVRLHQPLIVAFIAVGIILGPEVLALIEDADEIQFLAKIGIALLLFIVGLRLDLHLIRTVGPVALAAGLGQVVFTSAVGFVIALALGLELVPAVYVAIALTFSSTIIIVKLLSDKREIEETHGKIALGILIVQDIVVVMVMIALTAFGDAEAATLWTDFGLTLVRGVLFLGAVGLLMKFVLPWLLDRLARERELLILFAIAWAIGLAAGSDLLGFSEEVGAFVAGVSLASTGYRQAIGGRLMSVRDFLLLFFFINLGVQLDFSDVAGQITQAVVLSLFVLIGNPLIVMTIMGVMGYRKRTSFLTGLTVAQISEFSLIFAALGLTLGHIGGEAVGLITVVGVITIALSTYLILFSKEIYPRMAPFLNVFEREGAREKGFAQAARLSSPDLVVFGLGRFGGSFVRELGSRVRILGVDFDPRKVNHWRADGVDTIYGDVGDPELPDILPLERTRWVVSAVPDLTANLTLLGALREVGFEGEVALTAHTADDAEQLEEAGADLVLKPFEDAASDSVARLRIPPTPKPAVDETP